MKKSVFVLFFLCLALSCDASVWPAVWIGCHAEKSGADLRVAYFRKSAQLNTVPDAHLIRVSADNRYKLFVNGVLVSLGPARSDLSNWNYETVDIAPYLRQGKNTLAAVVWNYGEKRPMAQMGTNEIALLVCADGAAPVFNTDWNWQVLTGESYSSLDDFVVPGYYAADRGERFDANNYPWGWQTEQEAPGFDWKQARNLDAAADKGTRDRGGRLLVPRSIPQMEMREVSAGDINLPLTVAPHTRTSVLIDRDSLTNAYLHLTTSGGKGASVEVCYAEALFNPDMPDIWHATKPHRDETTGKVMMGVKDQFLMDGGTHRQTTTLWWRTWRYLELTVETADEALTIERLGATFTAYPLKKESHLRAGRELEQMEKIGWRTARLCANETYMDCPYYEQLQYFGDARIQAMLTLYNTRDTLLPRHAIEQGRMSMTADGLTQSRYPSASPQMISSYSLSWIGMLYDYWMMRDGHQWLRQYLPAARHIIGCYEEYLRTDKSLARMPHWFFADWATGFDYGEPNYGQDGSSAYQDLVFVMALREQAAMEKAFGLEVLGNYYHDLARQITAAIKAKYWNSARGLLADTPEHDVYSQHVNALAILAEVLEEHEAQEVCRKMLDDTTLIQATFYFRYFVQQAMDKVGMANRLLDTLQPWRDQLAIGLTTWAENPEPSRSDCHAWSAHLNIEFYRMLLGIHSAAPGFAKVRLTPALGHLSEASGSIPHPLGSISVAYLKTGQTLHARIMLPEGVHATLEWKGQCVEVEHSQELVIAE